jgi:hypothetical protein
VRGLTIRLRRRAPGEDASAVVVGFAQERLAVALGQPTAVDQLDRLVR